MTASAATTRANAIRVARNSALLGLSGTASLLLGFVSTILVTDRLGESYGILIGAQRFVALFLIVIQFGMRTLVIRAVARGQDHVGEQLGTVLTMRVFLVVAFGLLIGSSLQVSDYLPEYHWLIAVFALMEILDGFTGPHTAICEGREYMGRVALVSFARSALTFAGVLWIYFESQGLREVAYVYLASRGAALGIAVLMARQAFPALHLSVRFERILPLMREAALFVGIGLSYQALRSLDVVLLTRLSSTAETALYGVALNFLDVILYLPLLAQRALLPVFARLDLQGGSSEMARRSMEVFMAVLFPAVVGLVLLADQAVALYPSGQFDAAAPVVRILTCGILFAGPSMVIGTLLTGVGRLWAMIFGFLVAIPVQVIGSFLLAPAYGAVGTAMAFLAAYIMLLFARLASARGLGVGLPWFAMLRQAGAAAVMGAAVVATRDLFIAVPIAVGAAVYATTLLAIAPERSLERRAFAAFRERLSSGS